MFSHFVRLDDDALRRFLIFISFEESSITFGGAFSHLECFRTLFVELSPDFQSLLMILNLFWPETEENRKQFASIYWRPLCCWKEMLEFKLISILLRHVLNFPEMYSKFSHASGLRQIKYFFSLAFAVLAAKQINWIINSPIDMPSLVHNWPLSCLRCC